MNNDQMWKDFLVDCQREFDELKTSGQIAYEAYVRNVGGCSTVSGDKLPDWDGLSAKTRIGWESAAGAVLMNCASQSLCTQEKGETP